LIGNGKDELSRARPTDLIQEFLCIIEGLSWICSSPGMGAQDNRYAQTERRLSVVRRWAGATFDPLKTIGDIPSILGPTQTVGSAY